MENRDILVSGGGIAGAALAYWLRRYGFRPTVVERAPAPRTGGHGIDIRGTARQVIERMGLVPRIQDARIRNRGMAWINAKGKPVATMNLDVFGPSGGPVAEWALLRTDLARILYDAIRDDVEYVFDDAITGVRQDADGVTATFEKAEPRRFDLLVGADGVHSAVRGLSFGPDDRYVRDLNSFIALYSIDSDADLGGRQLMYTLPGRAGRPGRTAALRPLAQPGRAMAGFFFRDPGLDFDRRDTAAQKRVVARHFADADWEVPGLLAKMWDATDFYFDRVEQVHLDTWSTGRTVLVGDAAYCASPMSGIGTSLALVGAYVLAGELSRADGDHRTALAAYEAAMRQFVDRAQEFARRSGDGGLLPDSSWQMWLRNQSVRALPYLPRRIAGRGLEPVAHTVTLADYATPAHH
ncbi:FAD-dependent monooxygenase [Streptomyces olivaceus]|uniref:FAD-dependent monooxygenase n=1 Tax=Streptomyces olivaceus TaxID=47716 RepID=UPI001CCA690F|nr:FAD-dependent monooxygenase [Streptomyces olivaceus]MBZ6230900.1 FAD-dependent monooxygenase [Streptomyces olivaceus]